jgi:hypothetical protein
MMGSSLGLSLLDLKTDNSRLDPNLLAGEFSEVDTVRIDADGRGGFSFAKA